ncbi:unnamed protein product [Phytophthora fragariaefolia]|uniref:Unnamed protein product n=1 Tax=Phytophthora fragariaefolia TaxID=1490495 RepID=A0A9W7CWH9_9STRA|nr:unnamed protein product [Phytophthora fragariaefolia]
MPLSLYRDVGAAFMLGVVTRYSIANEQNADNVSLPHAKFQIQWTCTAFQSKDRVHHVSEVIFTRGILQFANMENRKLQYGESRTSLCNMVPKISNIPALTDEIEEMDERGYREWFAFRGRKELQRALCPGEVEEIASMPFSPTAPLDQASGLVTHPDGSSTTRLRQESPGLFGHLATSSFFAYIPLSFWGQVVVFTNDYADASGSPSSTPVRLEELMKFLGILWYMILFDKGEMRNYWVDDEEATIFFSVARTTSLALIMTWRRYLYIRKNLSFRSKVSTADINRDPAVRIRPLISILKSRCMRHVEVGRNVAVDEASIAC